MAVGIKVENAAFDGFGSNFSKTVQAMIMKLHAIIETASHTHLPDMMWLTASGRLQTAIVFCVELRKTRPTGNDSNNSAPV